MSRVVIQGDASGTGDFTIAAPNSNTDRTLTLPDVTGNVVTTGDTSTVTETMINGSLGKVLQVVSTSGPASTVSKTGAGSLEIINAAITPSSTSSKIYIAATCGGVGVGGSNTWIQIQIWRDASNIKNGPYGGDLSANASHILAVNHLDSPSSTSAITYRLQLERVSSGTNGWDAPASRASITLMEIAG
jgi:hypothetical protein